MVKQIGRAIASICASFALVAGVLSLIVISVPTAHAQPTTTQLQPSYSSPSWWSGDCDDTNYYAATGKHSSVLEDTSGNKAIWRGIEACGPRPKGDNAPDRYLQFPGSSTQEQEFECTELVKRYLDLAYGMKTLQADGAQLVSMYTAEAPNASYGSGTYGSNPFYNHRIVNDGHMHIFPVEGDVLSFSYVHTAIVIGVHNLNSSNGSADIDLIEQNYSASGFRTISMAGWVIGDNVSDWMTPRDVTPIPGGVYNSSTPADGSLEIGSVAVSVHASDNSGLGLSKVNITQSVEGSNSWTILKTYTAPFGTTVANADVSTTFQMPDLSNVLISFDVYSNNGLKNLAPNGIRRFCPVGWGSCFPYNFGSQNKGGGDSGQNPSTCTLGSNQVALFVDPNYSGSCIVLGIGSYTDPTAIGLPNDSISSVKVGGGVQVELCRDAGLSNTCEWVSTNVPDLSTHSVGDNQVSSAQVMGGVATTGCSTPGADQVTLFDSTNYGGLCITKELGTYPDPGSMGLPNDSVQSVQVGSDVKVELCRDAGLSNTCEWISTNVPDLSTHSIGTQQASSAEVSLNGGISLCDGTNFTGNCKSFPDGMTNLSDYGWANRARSVKFSDVYNHHYHIVLYTGTSETGYLYHADSDVADLGSPYDGNIQSINIYPHVPPNAPTTPTPADQTVLPNATTSVNLSWNGSDQAQVHVWNNSYNFTQGWQSSNSLQLTGLVPGVYFWQVQAQDDMGPGPWSDVWSFTINTAPQVIADALTMIQGTTATVQVQAIDAENQSLALSASNLPSFATFTDNHNGIGTLTFAPQAGNVGNSTITINANDGDVAGSGQFVLTVTTSTDANGVELLTNPWHLSGSNGDDQADMGLDANVLSGMTAAQITFDLHGTSFGLGDDEASIVFIQNNDWQAANVIPYGQNGKDGSQTITIPLTDFHKVGDASIKLDPNSAVSNLHARFWNSGSFTVDITSVKLISGSTPTSTPTPTATPTGTQPFIVYDEGLAADWGDWSWCSDNNFTDTSHPHTGNQDISWTVSCAYGGLSLHLPSGVDTTGYASLTFALQASQSGQTVQISLYDSSGNTGSPVQLDSYGGTPGTSGYTVYTIPLSAFQSTMTITGILIQNITGNATEPPMYVDTIMFQSTSATPTPTPTSTPTGIQPYIVYDEGLAQNWGDWSWCSDNNLADTTYPNTGSNDISWTVTCAYGGLSLHLPSGVDTTGYTSLMFSLRASQPGQTVQISLYDSNGNTGNPVQLDSYGGTPGTDGYTDYIIPLSAFQSTTTITGILIQDITGNATEPPMYVDTIEFA